MELTAGTARLRAKSKGTADIRGNANKEDFSHVGLQAWLAERSAHIELPHVRASSTKTPNGTRTKALLFFSLKDPDLEIIR